MVQQIQTGQVAGALRKIDALDAYRNMGLQIIAKQEKGFTRKCRHEFNAAVGRIYITVIEQDLRKRGIDDATFQRRMGINQTTLWRWLAERVTISFDNFIALLHVFEIDLSTLQFPNAREAVISGMTKTLAEIAKELGQEPDTALDRVQWECLRRVYLSEEWYKAAGQKDKELREVRLMIEGTRILRAVKKELEMERLPVADVPSLRQLVKLWSKAWIIFFSVVPYRWEV